MRKLILFSTIVLGLSLIFSCSKTDEDQEAPQISINSPAQGSSYIPENDVPIRIEITENDGLLSYSARVTSDADQSVLWEKTGNESGTSFEIVEDWFAPAGFDGTVTLSVEAEDQSGNSGSASVGFTIAP